jgi:nucleotide-binding universal stress UspA family protein
MKILVPVDGSAHAKAALDFVASRSTMLGRAPDVQLVNVQPALSTLVRNALGEGEGERHQQAQAEEILAPAAARLRKAGIEATQSYAVGHPAEAIGAVARKRRADLIVMGSRGLTALKGLLFGSMAQAVLAGCSTPVLMLRSARAPKRDSLAVGIALDGDRLGEAAVDWVIRHRELFGPAARLELIHVHDGGLPVDAPLDGLSWPEGSEHWPLDAGLGPAFDAVTAPARARLTAAGVESDVLRLVGRSPGDVIAACARRRRLDLLVMGSHGRGALKSAVLGSVAQRVASRCELPLLLIRTPEGKPPRPVGGPAAGGARREEV